MIFNRIFDTIRLQTNIFNMVIHTLIYLIIAFLSLKVFDLSQTGVFCVPYQWKIIKCKTLPTVIFVMCNKNDEFVTLYKKDNCCYWLMLQF